MDITQISPIVPLLVAVISGIFSLVALAIQWRKGDAEAAREYAEAAQTAVSQCEILYKRIQERDARIDKLETDVDAREDELKRLKERVSILEELIVEKDKAISAMLVEQTELRKRVGEQEEEIAVLSKQIYELGSKPRSARRRPNGGSKK